MEKKVSFARVNQSTKDPAPNPQLLRVPKAMLSGCHCLIY